jgi:hypothetical protein
MKNLILPIAVLFLFISRVCIAQTNPVIPPKHLQGRYIIKGAGCAGFNFINEKMALWYNEVSCVEPDTLRIKWVDENSFLAINKFQISKNCPPRVEYYKVVSNNGKQLVLKSVWTGLNEYKDQLITFNKK